MDLRTTLLPAPKTATCAPWSEDTSAVAGTRTLSGSLGSWKCTWQLGPAKNLPAALSACSSTSMLREFALIAFDVVTTVASNC
jgi:hypothetical protein